MRLLAAALVAIHALSSHGIYKIRKAIDRVEANTAQPAPQAAIELIHKQPVRWTHERMVSCDGGGGPLGHPRVYINVDKPQICTCGYCGLPFVSSEPTASFLSQDVYGSRLT